MSRTHPCKHPQIIILSVVKVTEPTITESTVERFCVTDETSDLPYSNKSFQQKACSVAPRQTTHLAVNIEHGDPRDGLSASRDQQDQNVASTWEENLADHRHSALVRQTKGGTRQAYRLTLIRHNVCFEKRSLQYSKETHGAAFTTTNPSRREPDAQSNCFALQTIHNIASGGWLSAQSI